MAAMEEVRAPSSESLCMVLDHSSVKHWWCLRPHEEDQCAGAGRMIPRRRRFSGKIQFARHPRRVKRQRAPYEAQHPVVQMVRFVAVGTGHFRGYVFAVPQSFVPRCVLSKVKNSAKGTPEGYSDENAQELNKMGNWRGLISSGSQLAVQVAITALQGHTGRMPWSAAAQDQAASEPETTECQQQQQQQQQQQGGTPTGVKHVAELGSPSAGFSTAPDQGCLPAACQGETEKDATKFQEISGGCLAVAATEYPNGQHFLKDNAELGGQQCGDRVRDEPDNNLSGDEPRVTAEHGISISPFITTNTASTTWLMASGALHHATGNRDVLCDFMAEHGDLFVKTGDTGAVPMRVLGRGSVVTDTVVLHDVWYVPGLTVNVVSVSQLAELDYSVVFGGSKCYVRSDDDGTVVGVASAGEDGLFALDFIRVPPGFL